jgi:hypothetical protein
MVENHRKKPWFNHGQSKKWLSSTAIHLFKRRNSAARHGLTMETHGFPAPADAPMGSSQGLRFHSNGLEMETIYPLVMSK